jgi:nitroimidazol reductase NimA-like FMN-containing flavoprotein (pyridoxamine 5'-phosphate oxidase superfamily)
VTDPWLEALSEMECTSLLRTHNFGRVAFLLDDAPMILPITYRAVEPGGRLLLALRTRPENVIDRDGAPVAFEIDGIDAVQRQGWSVVVRGTLHRLWSGIEWVREQFDPHPWLTADRDAWLLVEPLTITGRRLHSGHRDWAFDSRAYL